MESVILTEDINRARQVVQFLKHCRIGDRVKVEGKLGTVMNRAGMNVQVKFPDAHMEWIDHEKIETVLMDTRLKSCPFCNSEKTAPVSVDKAYDSEEVWQCMKCSQRFSVDKEVTEPKAVKQHCVHCGKKSAHHISGNVYKCESCLTKFTL